MKKDAVFLVLFSFAVGYFILDQYSLKQKLSGRDPAAIRQLYDFTDLKGSALEKAVHEQIASRVILERQEGSLLVSVGHFAFTNSQGEHKFACEQYSNITLKFEAEGVVNNGERPTMLLSSPCRATQSLAQIDPLKLPIARIMNEKPIDGDLNYSDIALNVTLKNFNSEWPEQWILTGITYGENQSDQLSLDRNEIVRFSGKPIVFRMQK